MEARWAVRHIYAITRFLQLQRWYYIFRIDKPALAQESYGEHVSIKLTYA